MTDAIRALRIDLDGKVRDLYIGTTLTEQSKVIARALLDSAEAVQFIRRTSGPSIVVLAGEHRDNKLPNLYAGLAVHGLAGSLGHELQGPVVFAGYTQDGELADLPQDAVTEIRELCPTKPDGIPAIVHIR
ncbi:hypothetical protein OG453_06980 [Streptomyces sp. NBC_01381]|uniref:hypothetical protein n=1 Tax=Streptomyces sp. NBC_01381 TaxID=2903845 RepID=UPI002254675F|nr:hypothetical protein [Streptomyces sp. NBC_01381]MCX4666411.1 hypothetical protein [Streptomyces sp. NBC_01381]